jgi:hypothetical protein
MNRITCNGTVSNLKLVEGALKDFTSQEMEILQYALWTYGHVNCTGFAVYDVSIESWINEIKKVYDISCPRNQDVITVLCKLV